MGSKKSFLLRVNQKLWNELEAWAADEFRSVNGQIEYILKQAIIKHRGKSAFRNNNNPDNLKNKLT